MVKGLLKVCSGRSSVAARCSPEEYLVARGEAVFGKGLRRTGDDEVVDDGEESVSARDRIDSGGNCSLVFVGWLFAGLLAG
jgi:hypothetical protein